MACHTRCSESQLHDFECKCPDDAAHACTEGADDQCLQSDIRPTFSSLLASQRGELHSDHSPKTQSSSEAAFSCALFVSVTEPVVRSSRIRAGLGTFRCEDKASSKSTAARRWLLDIHQFASTVLASMH